MSRPIIFIPISKQPKEVQWLYKHKATLSISSIEKQLNMAANTIYHYFSNRHGINEKWIPVIQKWVKEFRKLS